MHSHPGLGNKLIRFFAFLCLFSTGSSLAQNSAGSQSTMDAPPICGTARECVAGLKQNLRRDVPLDVASWAVYKKFVDASLSRPSQQIYALGLGALGKGSQFDTKTTTAYMTLLRTRSTAISRTALVESGVPVELAQQISERLPRPYLASLEQALIINALESQADSQAQITNAIHSVRSQSLDQLLVSKTVDLKGVAKRIKDASAGLKAAVDSPRLLAVQYVPDSAGLSPADLNKLRENLRQAASWGPHKIEGLESDVLKCLNNKANTAFVLMSSIEDRRHAIDAIASEIVQRADGITKPTSAIPMKLDGDASKALNILTQVGQFQDLQRTAAAQIVAGGIDMTASVQVLQKDLQKQWEAVSKSVPLPTGEMGLPPSLIKAAKVGQVATDFARILQDGGTNGVIPSNLIEGLATIAGQNGDAKSVDLLVTGFKAISDGKTSAFQASGVILTSLSKAVPALSGLSNAFNTVAPILQAAGPFLALASLSSPAGILQIAGMFGGGGGLFGGGSNDSEQLNAINAALVQISAQLQNISKQLKELQDTINQNQIKIMDALESISFDVNRYGDLLKIGFMNQTFGPCQRAQNDSGPFQWSAGAAKDLLSRDTPYAHVSKCDVNLSDFMDTDQGRNLRLAIF